MTRRAEQQALGLRARLLALAAILGLLGIGVFSAVALAVRDLRRDGDSTRRSQRVLAAAYQLERRVLDLQTGERGYLLTMQPRFLRPWREARRAAPVEAAALRRLVANDPMQARRAAGIEAAIRGYVDDHSFPAVTSSLGGKALDRIAITVAGERRVADIRRRFAGFAAAEERLSTKRMAHADSDARLAIGTALAAALAAAGLLVLALVYVSRWVIAPVRRLSAAAQRIAGGDFAARLTEDGPREVQEVARSFNAMGSFLQVSRDELKSQTTINTAVLEAAQDAVLLIGPNGETLLANAATSAVAAAHDADIGEGPDATTAGIATRVSDPAAYDAWIAALAADPTRADSIEYEIAATGRWFLAYSRPVTDAEGRPLGRLYVVRETTSERQAERLKAELVATVSHELRTPLASILGFAELLLARDPPAETRRCYVETIHSQGRRLTALIDDFLDLQRIEDGRFELNIRSFALDQLLHEEVELFRGQSAAHRLELDLPDASLAALGDRTRLARVVANLLSNAIKYSPDGGLVAVAAARHNGAVRVTVEDNGVGIPASQRAHVFEKFFRAESARTRTTGGTGLGLALAREIVVAHGGRIDFDSREGGGSTFWFEVPAA